MVNFTKNLTLLTCLCLTYTTLANEEGRKQDPELSFIESHESCSFNAPKGWEYIDTKALPGRVKIFVQGKGEHELPPSINLAIETTDLTLGDYLNTSKSQHESLGYAKCNFIGTMQTAAGPAQLMQVTQDSQWGKIRLLQAIVMKNHTAYIVSTCALEDEFAKFYPEFFHSIQSFVIHKNIFDMIPDESKREHLKKNCLDMKEHWPQFFVQNKQEASELSEEGIAVITFDNPKFQGEVWKPFKSLIAQEFNEMGPDWQKQILKQMEQELIHTRPEEFVR